MLRLGTFEDGLVSGPGATGPALAPSMVAQALGNLVSERQREGAATAAIEHFCAALLGDRPGQALAYLERLLACGMAIDSIYETFIPRTAARLGELWVEDVLSFTAVTIGMSRLTDAFRSLSTDFMRSRQPMRRTRRALFALVPGDDHALGVVMAADYFERAGWAVQVELRADHGTLVDIAASQPFHLVGLSAGSRRMIPPLTALVAELAAVNRPGTPIVVGGAITALEPALGDRLGIETAGGSATEALYRMEHAI